MFLIEPLKNNPKATTVINLSCCLIFLGGAACSAKLIGLSIYIHN